MIGDGELSRDQFEDFVAAALERIERDGPGALDELCTRHPEAATRLRQGFAALQSMGLVAAATKPDDHASGLADFELLGELGRGGMGVVFRARQRSLDRLVAVKMLALPMLADERTTERFRREAETVARLSHPGIVGVHGVGSADGAPFVVMELVDGRALDAVIAELRQRPLATLRADDLAPAPAPAPATDYPEAVVKIGLQVASALAHAHERGIVHRDVKPSNILLRPDGSVALTDFGLAWRPDLPSLTRTGAFAGTPYYASPEQARGDPLDARSDQFGLGVVLYELLTLRRPFDGDSTQAVLARIQRAPPPPLHAANPTLAPDLAAIVGKLLHKRPEDRYVDTAAVAADLQAFLERRPVAARPLARWRRLQRWCQREPLRAAFAAVLALAIPTLALLLGQVLWLRPKAAVADAAERAQATAETLTAGHAAPGRNAAAEAFHEVSAHVESHGTLVLSLAGGVDAEAALAHIARHEQLFAQHRCLRRIHAYALRRAGESERADRIEDELGEPSESFEAYLLGQIATFAIGREPGAAERAVHYLALAVALADSPRFEFYVQLALAARHADDAEAARTTARVLESRFADRPDVWESVGHARAVFDPAGARAAFERACELEPTAIHYGNLAGAALVLEDYEAAEAASRRGLECDAGSAFVRGGLVLALAGQARHAEAVAEAEATLKVDPGRTIVLAALFDGCRELGELGRAVPSLARCARALPAAIEPRLLLATCLVESDRAELVAKAATVLDEIDRLAPAPEQQAAAAELRRRLDAR